MLTAHKRPRSAFPPATPCPKEKPSLRYGCQILDRPEFSVSWCLFDCLNLVVNMTVMMEGGECVDARSEVRVPSNDSDCCLGIESAPGCTGRQALPTRLPSGKDY